MIKSIPIIGWSAILLSIIVIAIEIFNLFSNPIEQLEPLLNFTPQFRNSIEAINQLFTYNRIWSSYLIIYFLFIIVGSAQFLRFKSVGSKILEIVCWIGILNAIADSFFSYILWKNVREAFANTMPSIGTSIAAFSALGYITIVIGFLLWIIPSIGMIIYLRRVKLKLLMH